MKTSTQVTIGIVGVAVVAVVAVLGVKGLKGLFSGDNALTRNQTNAAGEKTVAYQGAGLLGTLGAGVNTASGGHAASLGETLGGWFASVTGADKNDEVAAMLKGTPAAPRDPPPIDLNGLGAGLWD